jgi:hypothetical protein
MKVIVVWDVILCSADVSVESNTFTFRIEGIGDMFFQHVISDLPYYTASHPKQVIGRSVWCGGNDLYFYRNKPKEPPLPIGYEAGWAPEPVWSMRKREKSLFSAVDLTWGPVCSPSLY